MSNISKSSFSNRAACKKQVVNLETTRPNQVNFDGKSLTALGPKYGTTSHQILSLLKSTVQPFSTL